MERRLACMSRTLPAVVLSALVMSFEIQRWIGMSFLVIAIEPSLFLFDGEDVKPVNQTSAAYVKAGITTVL